MQRARGLTWALPLASVLFLAGCGGEGGDPGPDRQAGNSIAVGEPNPGGAIDTSKFVAQAQDPVCADVRNRLFVIDQQYVFWDRAGNCADAAYSYRLYGNTTEKLLCSQEDSIAGPRSACSDDAAKTLFDIIVKHPDASDLGLGSGHKVEKVNFTVLNPPFVQIDRRFSSGISTSRNVVIKDAGSWNALWREHAPEEPVPAIDFSTTMVLGVFMGTQPGGCYATDITGVTHKDGKLIVARTDSGPNILELCTMVITTPGQLVRTARSDEPVEFVTIAKKPQ